MTQKTIKFAIQNNAGSVSEAVIVDGVLETELDPSLVSREVINKLNKLAPEFHTSKVLIFNLPVEVSLLGSKLLVPKWSVYKIEGKGSIYSNIESKHNIYIADNVTETMTQSKKFSSPYGQIDFGDILKGERSSITLNVNEGRKSVEFKIPGIILMDFFGEGSDIAYILKSPTSFILPEDYKLNEGMSRFIVASNNEAYVVMVKAIIGEGLSFHTKDSITALADSGIPREILSSIKSGLDNLYSLTNKVETPSGIFQ